MKIAHNPTVRSLALGFMFCGGSGFVVNSGKTSKASPQHINYPQIIMLNMNGNIKFHRSRSLLSSHSLLVPDKSVDVITLHHIFPISSSRDGVGTNITQTTQLTTNRSSLADGPSLMCVGWADGKERTQKTHPSSSSITRFPSITISYSGNCISLTFNNSSSFSCQRDEFINSDDSPASKEHRTSK